MFKHNKRNSDTHNKYLSSSADFTLMRKSASIGNSFQPQRTVISAPIPSPRNHSIPESNEMRELQLYIELLSPCIINKRQLYKESWKGIAWQLRHKVWRVLLGQTSIDQTKRKEFISKSRIDYMMKRSTMLQNLSIADKTHQIQIQKDLIRSDKSSPFLFNDKIQSMMENILLVWALRHPACGYVQGMNDLLVPFIHVYLIEYIYDQNLPEYEINKLSESILDDVEADCYYGLDSILSRIQDNYTFEQQGILNKIEKWKEYWKLHHQLYFFI
ncbi:Rab-GAP TBC domain-containing protein [Entamoeba marina]